MLVVRFYTPFAMFAMRLFIPNGFECFWDRCVDDVFFKPGRRSELTSRPEGDHRAEHF